MLLVKLAILFPHWYNVFMSELETQNSEENKAPERAPREERAILIIVAVVVIFLDQLTKWLVESNLAIGEVWEPSAALAPLFRVVHTFNTGAAFGLFAGGSLFFAITAVIVSIAILFFNHRLEGDNKWLRIALGLQLGGALGNFIDRVRIGQVTDFVDLGPWPFLFNIADLAVVSGAVLLAILVWQESREEQKQKQQAEANSSAE